MPTPLIAIRIVHEDRHVFLEVPRESEQPLARLLGPALARLGIQTRTASWLLLLEGRRLLWSDPLTQAIPDLMSLDSVVLQILPNGADEAPEDGLADDGESVDEEAACDMDMDEAADDLLAASTMDACADLDEAPAMRRRAAPMAGRTASHEPEELELGSRTTAVRYFSRMNPLRCYPLLVLISSDELRDLVLKDVEQRAGPRFQAALDRPVEIEPILPGCQCYPPRRAVDIRARESRAEFWVVPHVLGPATGAHIALSQGGQRLAEIPIATRVSRHTLTVIFGLLTFLLPVISVVLQHYRLDLASQLGEGFGAYGEMGRSIAARVPPLVLSGILLGMTCGTYLLLKPRQRDRFWNLGEPTGSAEEATGGIVAAIRGACQGAWKTAVRLGISGILGGLGVGAGLLVVLGFFRSWSQAFDWAVVLFFGLPLSLAVLGVVLGVLYGGAAGAIDGWNGED